MTRPFNNGDNRHLQLWFKCVIRYTIERTAEAVSGGEHDDYVDDLTEQIIGELCELGMLDLG